MGDSEHGQLPRLVPLGEPRALAEAEEAWIAALARSLDLDGLDAHVATAQAISECSCGCPSVGLISHGAPLCPEEIERITGGERDDYVAVERTYKNASDRQIEVILHMSTDGLIELEVWSSTHGREAISELPMPK
jgi:hypothetical protein